MQLRRNTFIFSNGRARVHERRACAGTYCTIHHPSKHKMNSWPMLLRETALIERTCPHGIGHPDPDSAAFFNRRLGALAWGTHGCDGCCVEPLDNEPGEANEPKCDICGEPDSYEDGGFSDWNGETGNHQSCEEWSAST